MSTQEHKKYLRQERVRKDKLQTVFFRTAYETTFTNNSSNSIRTAEMGLEPFKDVTCPFCLGLNKMRFFLISTKKGFNRSLGKCPLCQNGMRLQTLMKMTVWTPEQYAAFVYDYRRSGFWQKIQFPIWKKRLGMMGWTEKFWTDYKRLRGDVEKEAEDRELEDKWADYEASAEAGGFLK